MTQLRTIVVVGGSFAGTWIVDHLAPLLHRTHNVVLIEKNSHIQHLFMFPRISVVKGFEMKAFIPYTNAFHSTPRCSTSIMQGIVSTVLPERVVLVGGESIPYEYLIMATGTGTLPLQLTTKVEGMTAKRTLQDRMQEAHDVVVVGGGAYGIQLAFDAKEFYPHKHVTLVHSRGQLMPRFHRRLHAIVVARAAALGVSLILGQRVNIPQNGFPTSGPSYTVDLADGRRIPADVAVACIGNSPLSAPLLSLSPASVDTKSKLILVKPTMQIADAAFPRIFAIGDVAATGAHNAAGPAHRQAEVAAQNIVRMIAGDRPHVGYVPAVSKIRLGLGLHLYVEFQDPLDVEREPVVKFLDFDDGKHSQEEITRMFECRVQQVWERRAPGVTDYYL
ncbi:FAD/NAD(P)-binding domain-containing protein [Mycena venus]|uniref:FAD/NAD(P)-binding domain-containing protein n=1 Tax=Mycena venus TaxID=2733690 RepID=A0A8H6XMR2_9AGAR|nr:FAD/NAD(P)-binding domain-containing protein [Mycena venus]